MTVAQLKEHCGFRLLAGEPAQEKKVSGCYIGDLLSWAMGRVQEADAWITVMGNLNAIAVATLGDCSCIILCDNAPLDEDARLRAEQQQIAVLQSEEPAYAIACKLRELLGA